MKMTKAEIEKWLVMCGHAINANNSECTIIEAALCTATTVGAQMLADMEEQERAKSAQHRSRDKA